jgi:hypothetical protein
MFSLNITRPIRAVPNAFNPVSVEVHGERSPD